ncbi:uncharacterized protein BDR25DRAFT_326214 [Lindgomyces ingoldianus]|uniref:Uncharacterized protein n=1 Tax=Lindgomyces ingoldianus TaxID=673940 RepID=A0ACB6QQU8_9PLEO|nr:uncharacterized protein BDR25DRAFT_326214 [Lindgomyces ingoldianus]KAF2469363.1 hypothetical protein BDR25DRAFT_326214 [Lindgomyces ingoldianus]
MPALNSASLLQTLVDRSTFSASNQSANATSDPLEVVCAWPVSGQYGPGTRFLYYVLVAACVFARKAVWLRNACLAAALLFPAVAAIHGIVLATLHVNGAVDMDVFGAFQLCSIGILAAPLTVRLSRTYFFDPGRNTIFLWTGLVLAGLLSLTVEFYRINPSDCHDEQGNPLSRKNFSYDQTTCGLNCSVEHGPRSPMRDGSANNIYVIPAPDKLTFNTAMLLAAACCIPAILSLAFMFNKILEMNWRKLHRDDGEDERIDEPIEGTNGATIGKMKGVNSTIRMLLGVVEIPLFSGAVLAILAIGENNFFSKQVRFQTEPIASIGQWAPIAGTVLAVAGSAMSLLTTNVEVVNEDESKTRSPMEQGARSPSLISELVPTTSNRPLTEVGNTRRKISRTLTAIGSKLSTAAHDDVGEFKRNEARNYPETPGEQWKNPQLAQIRQSYNPPRDADGNVTPELRGVRSRASSFHSNAPSSLDIERIETAASPRPAARRDTLEVPAPTHRRSRSSLRDVNHFMG